MTTHDTWVHRQHELNEWRKKYLNESTPLRVDGSPGHLTWRAMFEVKWCLGYGRKAAHNHSYRPEFVRRMRHPRSRKFSSAAMIATGAKRRVALRARNRAQRLAAALMPGVTTFDGKPVAKAAVPILQWCRDHGWHGRLVSGWRSIAYSVGLCIRMCGRTSCPGLCGGASTNHVGDTATRFAVDVSDYGNFRVVVARCPIKPRIWNDLPRDPVHFSPSGH